MGSGKLLPIYQANLTQKQIGNQGYLGRKQSGASTENYLADETEPGKLQSERIFLESLMEILLSAHERLVEALDDLATKRVVQEKFEKMELEHSDMLKRLNQKITDLKQEKESAMSSLTAALSRRSKASNTRSAKSRLSRSSRSSAVIDRKADTAVKVAKLKTELYFADDLRSSNNSWLGSYRDSESHNCQQPGQSLFLQLHCITRN